jgi:hypothetical protein
MAANKNTLNQILSYSIAFISICLSYYWFQVSKKEVDPTFIQEKNTQQLLSRELVSKAPLTIYKSDGTEIKSNIFSQTFYFFNQGKEPITPDKVLEPLYISIPDSNGEILDFKILKNSRNITQCELRLDSVSKTKIDIHFKILEEDDGIVGQIIYSTNSSTGSPLKLEGTIQGAKHGFSSFYKNKMGINPIIISIAWSLIPPILIATLFLKLKRIYIRSEIFRAISVTILIQNERPPFRIAFHSNLLLAILLAANQYCRKYY